MNWGLFVGILILIVVITILLTMWAMYKKYANMPSPADWLREQASEIVEDIKKYVPDLTSMIPKMSDEIVSEKEGYRIYRRRYNTGKRNYRRRYSPGRYRYFYWPTSYWNYYPYTTISYWW